MSFNFEEGKLSFQFVLSTEYNVLQRSADWSPSFTFEETKKQVRVPNTMVQINVYNTIVSLSSKNKSNI